VTAPAYSAEFKDAEGNHLRYKFPYITPAPILNDLWYARTFLMEYPSANFAPSARTSANNFNYKEKNRACGRRWRETRCDLVVPLTSLALRGLDGETHLLRNRSTDEAADAVVLPVCGFGDVSDSSRAFTARKRWHWAGGWGKKDKSKHSFADLNREYQSTSMRFIGH
jgi:hypothetical protein